MLPYFHVLLDADEYYQTLAEGVHMNIDQRQGVSFDYSFQYLSTGGAVACSRTQF